MDVRIVRVGVHERRVTVRVHMPHGVGDAWVDGVMVMPVMLVVDVGVLVLHGLVRMFVLVSLSQVKPYA